MSSISGAITRLTPGQPPAIDSKLFMALSNPFGRHFYVNSGGGASAFGAIGGSDGNDGLSWLTPLATIDAALGSGYATANRGDVIHVAQGHVETVGSAGALDLDIAGVTLVGYGNGDLRPQISFTATGSDMDVDAANIAMHNFRFTGDVDAVVAAIDVNAAGFQLINCKWEDVTGQVTDFILTDANADELLIDGLEYIGSLTAGSSASGTNSGIVLVGCDNPTIRNCSFTGRFAIAAVECRTTAVVRLTLHDCRFVLLDNQAVGTAGVAVEDVIGSSTGLIGPNIHVHQQTAGTNFTEVITGATFRVVLPVDIVNLDDEMTGPIDWTASTSA